MAHVPWPKPKPKPDRDGSAAPHSRPSATDQQRDVASSWPPPSGGRNPPVHATLSNVISDEYELLDPHPDVHALFQMFDSELFQSRLTGVVLQWSKRMTLCAGLCKYEGRGGLCSISLSEPLLKFRSRKELVETLLHEMIHAYLFVTANNRDRDGHGEEFCKHMRRINDIVGTSITIYHTFHDEVATYRVHWWRCNGPCKDQRPFFGWVKRATNRAPSANDPWWAEHQATCGGTYIKVKEPEGYQSKKKSKAKQDPGHKLGSAASSSSTTASHTDPGSGARPKTILDWYSKDRTTSSSSSVTSKSNVTGATSATAPSASSSVAILDGVDDEDDSYDVRGNSFRPNDDDNDDDEFSDPFSSPGFISALLASAEAEPDEVHVARDAVKVDSSSGAESHSRNQFPFLSTAPVAASTTRQSVIDDIRATAWRRKRQAEEPARITAPAAGSADTTESFPKDKRPRETVTPPPPQRPHSSRQGDDSHPPVLDLSISPVRSHLPPVLDLSVSP
ncbi:zinc finger RAD18 domain-containing protein C1, partial [Capsaspora owczarzaki ATCC 30864]